ncbi:peptidase inhibitor family I36 protein [Saccharothrix australiensis]|uniref:Peptidase inhibitor family I36 n=1 Tax=Saccharothrix australiensis TaxID=2072 RepID=A0A495W6R1_9PSEU|nr:peptidase inhibitor family I36 protein [Saccharothrix australiensis]RKT56777.1 peptidase inhibitor family I36 [Saccharothrix australiensis]
MIRRLAAGLLAAAALVPLSATSAQAAPYACDARHVCLWQGIDFTLGRQVISGFAEYTDLGAALKDQASSWGSSTNQQVMCVFDWVNGNRQVIGRLAPGNRTPWVGDGANDRSDAVGWC